MIVKTNNNQVAIEVLSAQNMIPVLNDEIAEISIKAIGNSKHGMNEYDAEVELNGFKVILFRDLDFLNIDLKKFTTFGIRSNITFEELETPFK